MELRQLRYFVAVVDNGTISAAAKTLGVRQPTVSNHIRRLEDRIGTNLFERGSRGMRLTFEGRNLSRTARRIVEEVDHALNHAERVAQVEVGMLSLGFYTSLSSGPLRETLKAFRSSAPDVMVELHEGSPADLLAALRDRRIELALTVLDVTSGEFETQKMWDEKLVVALPTSSLLLSHDTLTWVDLAASPLVVRSWESGSILYSFLAARIAPNGYLPAEQHFISREALLGLVGIEAGFTVMGASAAEASFPGVVFRPLVGPDTTVPVTAVWRADNDNPARGRFLSMVRDWRPTFAQNPSQSAI